MTEEKNNHEEEVSIEETPLAEEWQEEMPPEDDFHDHPEVTISSDGEAEALAKPSEGKTSDKKSGTPVLISVIAVFAIFIVTMVYIQYGTGKKGTGDKISIEIPKAEKSIEEKQIQSNQYTISSGGQTAVANVDSIYHEGKQRNTSPQASMVAIPAPQQSAVGDMQSPNAKISEMVAVAPPRPDNATVVVPIGGKTKQENISSTQKQTDSGSKTVETSAGDNITASIPADVSGVRQPLELKVENLVSQVESLKADLQQIKQQISQVTSKSETGGILVGGSALESRLDQIEQRIAKLSEKSGSIESKTANEKGYAVKEKDSVEKIREAKTKTKERATRKATKIKASEKKEQETKKWVLRAATPDSAWLSESPNASELRQVKVGDYVPGIGKVLSINQTAEGWALVGEKATVR